MLYSGFGKKTCRDRQYRSIDPEAKNKDYVRFMGSKKNRIVSQHAVSVTNKKEKCIFFFCASHAPVWYMYRLH